MWLITRHGFYSVVAHRDDPSLVLVRARRKEHLEALFDNGFLEPVFEKIIENGGADYRWRVIVPADAWRDAVHGLTVDIDYPNFKSAAAHGPGNPSDCLSNRSAVAGHDDAWADALYSVWHTMHRLQN